MANVNILFIVCVGVCDVEVAGPCTEKAILMACVGLAKAKLRKIMEIACGGLLKLALMEF